MSKIKGVKKIPETMKVALENDMYVLVVPMDEREGFREFWLMNERYGSASYMFGCEAVTEEDVLELIEANVGDHLSYFLETLLYGEED
jgi:hypothetical protein